MELERISKLKVGREHNCSLWALPTCSLLSASKKTHNTQLLCKAEPDATSPLDAVLQRVVIRNHMRKPFHSQSCLPVKVQCSPSPSTSLQAAGKQGLPSRTHSWAAFCLPCSNLNQYNHLQICSGIAKNASVVARSSQETKALGHLQERPLNTAYPSIVQWTQTGKKTGKSALLSSQCSAPSPLSSSSSFSLHILCPLSVLPMAWSTLQSELTAPSTEAAVGLGCLK